MVDVRHDPRKSRESELNERAQEILQILREGNTRFREGRSRHHVYGPEAIAGIASSPAPQAAIVACSDSRVSPEAIFDQPIGNLFVSRVPGNVASDSAKWMLEIAVSVLKVPLVLVIGHTDCLAVKQVVDGQTTGSGGLLRTMVSTAVLRAKSQRPADLFHASVLENARYSTEQLSEESWSLKQAAEAGQSSIASGYYDVRTGIFELVP